MTKDVFYKKHSEEWGVNMEGQIENIWHAYLYFSSMLLLMWSYKAE